MFAFGGFLQRFRSGVPGAPSPAGVPVDRRTELEAELAPVLALLADAQREAAELVAQAGDVARTARSASAARAQQLVRAAEAGAAAEQRTASAARIAQADEERRYIAAAGVAEAGRIEAAARTRVPALVDEIVGRLLGMAS